jgi:hypothetical protein
MKKLLTISILTYIFPVNYNIYAKECSSEQLVSSQVDTMELKTDVPKFLVGATICVKRADGAQSCVPAEKFKVVPRKQQFVVTQVTKNKVTNCSTIVEKIVKEKVENKKNTVYTDVRKDHQDLKTEYNGNKSVSIESEKGIVPSINYYRREVFDTPIGAGVGVDTNGTVRGALGIDF